MHKYILLFYTLIVLNGCSNVETKEEKPAPLVKFTSTLTVKTLWTTEAGKDTAHLKLAPVFHNEQLFTASPTGRIQAIDNGKQVWAQELDLPLSAGPGIGDGLILVGSLKGHVVALSEIDGSELWRVLVSSEILAKPRINQGIVVIRTIDGKLFGLNSQTGQQLWVYERNQVPLLSLRGTSTPIIKQNFIIAGFDNGKVAALELHTGKVLWESQIFVSHGRTELERMIDIDADPILVDDIIYVTAYQGGTVAIDLIQKKILWEKKLSSYAGLAVDYDHLYISDTNSHIWALDRYSGEEWWKQDKLHARKLTAPVQIGEYIVVGDFEGYLHWMRRDNGQFVARYQMDAAITVPPLVVDNILIAYDNSGDIVALSFEE